MANDGYSVGKAMRRFDIDVSLAVNVSDFGMALPEWEEARLSGIDPYDFSYSAIRSDWDPPDWIIYFDLCNRLPKNPYLPKKILSRLNLFKMVRGYDVVECHNPYSLYVQFAGKPYCPYDAGWIRYICRGRDFYSRLAQRSYARAKRVMFTNPDTEPMFSRLNGFDTSKLRFVPFAIDVDRYKPIDGGTSTHDPLLFCPSRHIWSEKGNDILIRAYSSFVREHPKSMLQLVNWGPDVQKSRDLISKSIPHNKVEWLNPMSKPALIEFYNKADIVLDQFVLGSWGTTTPEAMACGKSVLMYYNEEHISRCFGSLPPLFNCPSERTLLWGMEALADGETRARKGREARDWVVKTHDDNMVARRHYEILRTVAEGGRNG